MKELTIQEVYMTSGSGPKFFNVISGAIFGAITGGFMGLVSGGPAGALAGAGYGAYTGVAGTLIKEGASGLMEINNKN